MPRFFVPNNATIHTARSFLTGHEPFRDDEKTPAVLELHPRWAHMEPIALVMAAAWGCYWKRRGRPVLASNLGSQAKYAARMKLFKQLGLDFDPDIREKEEAGRFLPITRVQSTTDIRTVIGDLSALLHLQNDPESLAAVQYCLSELLRNVMEHSESPDGAFVCAHRFSKKPPHRVTLAVADCGRGIQDHLSQAHPEAGSGDRAALGLAMRHGITGALPGPYGAPDNAGAGLFLTRCIAKGTGGYFFLHSGTAAYRLRRSRQEDEEVRLFFDPYDEPRHDSWDGIPHWQGTAASVEIQTDKIPDYQGFFDWIRRHVPARTSVADRIRFT